MGIPWISPHKGSGGMDISLPVLGGDSCWGYQLQERPRFYLEDERKSALPQANKDGGVWLGLGERRKRIVVFLGSEYTVFPTF